MTENFHKGPRLDSQNVSINFNVYTVVPCIRYMMGNVSTLGNSLLWGLSIK